MKRLIVFLIGFFFIPLNSILAATSIEVQSSVKTDVSSTTYSSFSTTGEYIRSFNALDTIQKDGTISVQESIVYDFQSNERHGLYRKIPFTKTNEDGKKFILTIDQISVTDETIRPYTFEKSYDNDHLVLKIGDSNKTISGVHAYVISYRVSGALTYFSDYDEFYWNVTGNEWNVPIQQTQVTVILPVPIETTAIRHSCFTGSLGSKSSDCSTTFRDQSILITSGPLVNNQGLTFVVGFPKGIVAVLEPAPSISFFETLIGKITLVVLAIVAFFWYIVTPGLVIYRWNKYGRDPRPALGATTAWFDVPKTKSLRRLTPGESGTLIDEQADVSDITATIVDLARRGYLRIIETKKNDFSLEKKSIEIQKETLEMHEKTLLSGVFKDNDLIRIKDSDLVKVVEDTKKDLYNRVVTEGFFSENPQTTRTLYSVLAVFALLTGNIFLAVVSFFFGRGMPRKTLFGSQQAVVAQSLKNFLSSQEKKLEFQAKNQLFFEKLLPFAIAFGVEKIWAQRFSDVTMKPPVWYVGYGNQSFTSIAFVHSINSSMTSFRSAATPTRSSSGFSSGFSGGSSGGGGGGGGGGSW